LAGRQREWVGNFSVGQVKGKVHFELSYFPPGVCVIFIVLKLSLHVRQQLACVIFIIQHFYIDTRVVIASTSLSQFDLQSFASIPALLLHFPTHNILIHCIPYPLVYCILYLVGHSSNLFFARTAATADWICAVPLNTLSW